MSKLFGIETDEDLYRLLKEVWESFSKEPTQKDFLLLCFLLNHLREWIVQCGTDEAVKTIKRKEKSSTPLTEEENLFSRIFDLPEFQMINSFCNAGKHFRPLSTSSTTKVAGGMSFEENLEAEFTNVFVVQLENGSNVEVLDLFAPVLSVYEKWFEQSRS